MIITQQFIDKFTTKVKDANNDKERLTTHASWRQKNSTMRPIYSALVQRLNEDLDWSEGELIFNPLFVALDSKKLTKYSIPIKFLIKSLRGDGTHMFRSLHKPPPSIPPRRILSIKLAKSQQRFNTAVTKGDYHHGLCLQMAMLWLKEKLVANPGSTQFPRLADSYVIGNQDQQAVTRAAIINIAETNRVLELASHLGLYAEITRPIYNFANVKNFFDKSENSRHTAISITFFNRCHSVALYKEAGGTFLFYDANAGAYRVQAQNLDAFLAEYNDICLPLKWPGYNCSVTTAFNGLHTIKRRA
jgi:hypothetical protein